MLNPTMLEGRWLLPEDENAIVVSTNLLMEEPDLGVGDEVVLKINDLETNWHIVGVAHVAQSVSFAFADYDHFARVVRNVGRANMISISTERREIGVMRAIGASNGAVLRVIIVEGVVIGLMSWLLATLLSLPIGKLLSNAVGIQMFNTPLSYTVSLVGVLLWLGLVVLLSVLASFVPAQSAANLSVREVLAYEQ